MTINNWEVNTISEVMLVVRVSCFIILVCKDNCVPLQSTVSETRLKKAILLALGHILTLHKPRRAKYF